MKKVLICSLNDNNFDQNNNEFEKLKVCSIIFDLNIESTM